MFEDHEIDFAPIAFDSADCAPRAEHPLCCPCRDCDPDTYFDPAERFAGERDL